MRNLWRNVIITVLAINLLVDYSYTVHLCELFGLVVTPNRIFKLLPIIILIFLTYKSKRLLLYKPAIIIILATIISIANSTLGVASFGQTLDVWLRYFSSLVFIFIVGKNLTEEDLIRVFKIILLISLVPICISFLQYFGKYEFTDFDWVFGEKIGRVSGGYSKSVALVGVLYYGFAFSLTMFFASKSWFKKICYLAYLLLVTSTILLTFHRVTIVIIFITTILIGWLYGKKVFILCVAGILSVVVVCFAYDYLIDMYKTVGMASNSNFLRGRGGTWAFYLRSFFDSNVFDILFGKGNAVITSSSISLHHGKKIFNEPHNDYLRIMYQYGLVGISLFVWFLIDLTRRNWKFVVNVKDQKLKIIGVLSCTTGIAIILYSITIEPTRFPVFYWYYMALMSFIIVTQNQSGGNVVE